MDAGRAPVVVGVGQVVQRPDPGAPGPLDAVGLMVAAARRAGEDSGAPRLLDRVGAVLVPEGTWSPGDAAGAVAEALGCTGARTTMARIGVLQTTLFASAAAAIAAGHVDVALVVGGEAKASARDGLVTTLPSDGAADVELAADGDILTALEIERGLAVPVQSYAVQEDALRRQRGRTALEHRTRLDALWAGFADVAKTNPYAWDASTTAAGGRMIATPYARRHCSQWNVDMGVAVLLCASHVADSLDIPVDRRVHPLAVVDSDAMVPLSRRADLHRSPAVGIVGARLTELTGVEPAAVDHVELYSCFPSAVQVQAAELGIGIDRSLTVTGGMGYGGGPLNSAALHAVATMVDVLRADPGSTGLVTAVSGMLTKHGASLWSTEPHAAGFASASLTNEVHAATATVQVDPAYIGRTRVEGATVVHDREGPSSVVVVGRAADGRRVVVTSADRALAADFDPEAISVDVEGAVVRGR